MEKIEPGQRWLWNYLRGSSILVMEILNEREHKIVKIIHSQCYSDKVGKILFNFDRINQFYKADCWTLLKIRINYDETR